MFNFFSAVGEIFTTIVDFVISAVEMILGLLSLIGSAFVFLIQVVNYLPPFVLPFVLAFVCLAVLLQIINKGS